MSRPSLTLDFSSAQPFSFIPSPEIMITTPSKEYLRPAFDAEGCAPSSPMNIMPKTPRTPLRRLMTSFGSDSWGENTFSSDEDEEMTRPSSAASMYSSSSACSYGSMTSFNSIPPSASGCPENDDTFMSKEFSFETQPRTPQTKGAFISSARNAREPRNRRQLEKVDSAKDADWSEETDAHLWTTYNLYKNDPKVTPFYVPSGGVPPLGVCCRVSREAKRTWKVSRDAFRSQHQTLLSPIGRGNRLRANSNSLMVDAGEPFLRRPIRSMKGKRKMPAKWQYSESATRQRLRILCRRKSSDPHYQQRDLLSEPFGIARPIPFPSLTGPPTVSLDEFSSRNMTVSLIASTAESMKPSGPLATITAGMDNGNQLPQPMPRELLGQFEIIPSEPLPPVAQYPASIPENCALEPIAEAPQATVIRSNSGRRNNASSNSHRRNGSRGNVLHRKVEPSNVTGHRRSTSINSTSNSIKTAVEKEEKALPVVRKRTRVRSSSDASGSLRSIPRMLCLGAPFEPMEEGEDASQPSARRLHKRHQSLPVGRNGGPPPSLMPAIEFAPANRKVSDKKPEGFFEDLFAKQPEQQSQPETPNINNPTSNVGPVRAAHRKMRSRGLSFGERSRKSEALLQPPVIAESIVAEDSPSKRHGMLRRLGSPFREIEPAASIASCTEMVPLPAPAVKTTEVAPALASGFVSPPPRKHRRNASTPQHRERSILGLNLGFFLGRRNKKE